MGLDGLSSQVLYTMSKFLSCSLFPLICACVHERMCVCMCVETWILWERFRGKSFLLNFYDGTSIIMIHSLETNLYTSKCPKSKFKLLKTFFPCIKRYKMNSFIKQVG